MAKNKKNVPLYDLIVKSLETGATMDYAKLVKNRNMFVELHSLDKDTFVMFDIFAVNKHAVQKNREQLEELVESNLSYIGESYKSQPNSDYAELLRDSISSVQDSAIEAEIDSEEFKAPFQSFAKNIVNDLSATRELAKSGVNVHEASLEDDYVPTLSR